MPVRNTLTYFTLLKCCFDVYDFDSCDTKVVSVESIMYIVTGTCPVVYLLLARQRISQ